MRIKTALRRVVTTRDISITQSIVKVIAVLNECGKNLDFGFMAGSFLSNQLSIRSEVRKMLNTNAESNMSCMRIVSSEVQTSIL